MGNCLSWIKQKREPKKKLNLAIFGLDNAGKTVTAKGLTGESLETVAPTVGFSQVDFHMKKYAISLYDLGGGKRIRDIWKNYFGEIYGLIYVVDSTDAERMEECRDVIRNLLEHPKISGKPVLLLANKQDVSGAMDEIDLCENLNLEEIVNINKCPCRVERCSAILGQGRKLDQSIKKGMDWLLTIIETMHEKLSQRVELDLKEQKEKDALEKAARAERVRKIREERDRKEREEKIARGEDPDAEDDEPIMDGANPFKTLSMEELEQKEEKLKAQKKKEKEEKKRKEEEESKSDEALSPFKAARHHKSRLPADVSDDDDDDESYPRSSRSVSQYKRMSNEMSPEIRKPRSLENSPILSRRLIGQSRFDQTRYGSQEKLHGTDELPNGQKILPWMKQSPHKSNLNGYDRAEEDAMMSPPRRQLAPLNPISPLEPLENYKRVDKKRKKKKKPKRNQLAPASLNDEGLDTPDALPSHMERAPPQHHGWGTPPGQRGMVKASKSPTLDTLNDGPEEETFSSRWGLVDDLPDVDDSPPQRFRPNTEYDDDIIT